jgi:hypothetical protein
MFYIKGGRIKPGLSLLNVSFVAIIPARPQPDLNPHRRSCSYATKAVVYTSQLELIFFESKSICVLLVCRIEDV